MVSNNSLIYINQMKVRFYALPLPRTNRSQGERGKHTSKQKS